LEWTKPSRTYTRGGSNFGLFFKEFSRNGQPYGVKFLKKISSKFVSIKTVRAFRSGFEIATEPHALKTAYQNLALKAHGDSGLLPVAGQYRKTFSDIFR
jgi:hypothetical protein